MKEVLQDRGREGVCERAKEKLGKVKEKSSNVKEKKSRDERGVAK